MRPETRNRFDVTALRNVLTLRAAGVGVFVLVCLGWIFPDARLWGVHFLAFLHPAVSAILLICAAGMISPLGEIFIRWIRTHVHLTLNLSPWTWTAIAVVIFVGFRVREPLLGDGQSLLGYLVQFAEADAHYVEVVDPDATRLTEPIETMLHRSVFRTVAWFHDVSNPRTPDVSNTAEADTAETMWLFNAARWTYILLSAIAGGLLVRQLMVISKRLFDPGPRVLFLLTALSCGGMLLFFGYVEDYSWLALAICLCVLYAIEESALPDGSWPWKTLLWFGIAVGMHLMAVFLLPAIVVMVVLKKARPEGLLGRLVHGTGVLWIVAGGFAAVYMLLVFSPLKEFVVPLLSGYALLSFRHGLDLVNLFVLCGVVGVVVLRNPKSEIQNPKGRSPFADASSLPLSPALSPQSGEREEDDGQRPTLGFVEDYIGGVGEIVLQVAAVCGVGFVVLLHPGLGMPRDWDLYSVALWPVVLLVAWKIAKNTNPDQRDGLAAMIIGLALLVTVPYVLVHANTQSEVARTEAVLKLDPSRAAFGWDAMAAYYLRQNDHAHALEAFRHAVEDSPNPRYKVSLAIELQRAGKLEEAEPLLLAAAETQPRYSEQLVSLCYAYAERGDVDKAISLARTAMRLDPENETLPALERHFREVKGGE